MVAAPCWRRIWVRCPAAILFLCISLNAISASADGGGEGLWQAPESLRHLERKAKSGSRALPLSNNACSVIPTESSLSGNYGGFAKWTGNEEGLTHPETHGARSQYVFGTPENPLINHDSRTRDQASLSDASPKSRLGGSQSQSWEVVADVTRESRKLWDLWKFSVDLRSPRSRAPFKVALRGIRPSNSDLFFVEGYLNKAEATASTAKKALLSWLGESFSGDEFSDPTLHNRPLSRKGLCFVSGTAQRHQHELQAPVPLEMGARSFSRPPDLTLTLVVDDRCRDLFPSSTMVIAARKLDSMYRATHYNMLGAILVIKSLIEFGISYYQFTLLDSRRALMKTSYLTVLMNILFDSLEAQVFFSQQNNQPASAAGSPRNDSGTAAASPYINLLLLMFLIKILMVALVQVRWVVTLYKEQCLDWHRQQANALRPALEQEISRFVHSAAFLLIITVTVFAHLFYPYPELILALISLAFVPQIVQNVYGNFRHPLLPSYILLITFCRGVFAFLVFSPLSHSIFTRLIQARVSTIAPGAWDHNRDLINSNAANGQTWPPWFYDRPIPLPFVDSVFGSLPRRPNQMTTLFLQALLMAQALYLLLQSAWYPRIGLPYKFCERYLPRIFDYELDVPRVAALKQMTEADCSICFMSVTFSDLDCVVTPCAHFFHSSCLTKWMDIKLECPTCRCALPLI